MNFGSSEILKDKLTPSNTHSRCLTVPLFRKTSCRSFSYFASRLWNTLPLEIRNRAVIKDNSTDKVEKTKRLIAFKRVIKRWIMNGGVPFR